MPELTKNQAAVLRFIERNQKVTSPTYHEISAGIKGLSTSSAFEVVQQLASKGLVKVGTGARNIKLVSPSCVAVNVSSEVYHRATVCADLRGQEVCDYIEECIVAMTEVDGD